MSILTKMSILVQLSGHRISSFEFLTLIYSIVLSPVFLRSAFKKSTLSPEEWPLIVEATYQQAPPTTIAEEDGVMEMLHRLQMKQVMQSISMTVFRCKLMRENLAINAPVSEGHKYCSMGKRSKKE